MKILVFGASGGAGRAIVAHALAEGHDVTAFVRDAGKLAPAPHLSIVEGDAIRPDDVAGATPGHDAIVVSLGNSQNAFALLLGLRRTTPRNVCEAGTRNILAALGAGSTVPLIVVSAFGVGDTRSKLTPMVRLFYRLVLREQIADKERQEAALKASGADCLLIQPVALTDKPATGDWFASWTGEVRGAEISRADMAAFIVGEIGARPRRRGTVALSG